LNNFIENRTFSLGARASCPLLSAPPRALRAGCPRSDKGAVHSNLRKSREKSSFTFAPDGLLYKSRVKLLNHAHLSSSKINIPAFFEVSVK